MRLIAIAAGTLALVAAASAGAQQQPSQPGWPQPVDNNRLFGTAVLNQNEWRTSGGSDAYRWDGEGWYGDDWNRIRLKSEGNLMAASGHFGEAQVQALYSRAATRYFDIQGGVRYDMAPGPARGWLALGIEGLAPMYWNVGASVFLSDAGHAAGRFEGYYNLPLTQRLFLQPQFELNAYTKADPSRDVGSGVSDLDAGLRLRYEIRRQVAPYVGLTYESAFAGTADIARQARTPVSRLRFTAGVRLWR
ncbi:MAG: copper resistance protein B [Gemmatimonadota bacterium]|nr:copper resistance protein B [Gemmatimonadota bacterium]